MKMNSYGSLQEILTAKEMDVQVKLPNDKINSLPLWIKNKLAGCLQEI